MLTGTAHEGAGEHTNVVAELEPGHALLLAERLQRAVGLVMAEGEQAPGIAEYGRLSIALAVPMAAPISANSGCARRAG
jgi:hypothetical protein